MKIYEVDAEFTKTVLEKLKIGLGYQIGQTTLDSLDFSTGVDFYTGMLRAKLLGFILKDTYVQTTKDVEFEVPVNWWEHFKRDVLKVKKIQTEYLCKTVRFTQSRTYPHANEALLGRSYEYQTFEEVPNE